MSGLCQSRWQRYRDELFANWEIRRYRRQQLPDRVRPLRVAIVGLGRVARRHAWAYLKSRQARLVAGVDPDPGQREGAAAWGVERRWKSVAQMLEHEVPDVVSVCTPCAGHARAVHAAAAAGVRGILCEKPLATSLAEADELIEICQDRGALLSVGHQRRFSPQHRLARQLLRQGVLGRLRVFSGEWPRDTLRSGIHVADFLRFYVGEAASVVAQIEVGRDQPLDPDLAASLRRGRSDDRRGHILVRFRESRVLAFFEVKDMPLVHTRYHFLGEAGEMEVCCNGGLRLKRAGARRWETPRLEVKPQWLEFQLEIEALMAAVRGDWPLQLSGRDGRHSLEIVEAILRSAIDGREVSLPLDPDTTVRADEPATEAVHPGVRQHRIDPRQRAAALGT